MRPANQRATSRRPCGSRRACGGPDPRLHTALARPSLGLAVTTRRRQDPDLAVGGSARSRTVHLAASGTLTTRPWPHGLPDLAPARLQPRGIGRARQSGLGTRIFDLPACPSSAFRHRARSATRPGPVAPHTHTSARLQPCGLGRAPRGTRPWWTARLSVRSSSALRLRASSTTRPRPGWSANLSACPSSALRLRACWATRPRPCGPRTRSPAHLRPCGVRRACAQAPTLSVREPAACPPSALRRPARVRAGSDPAV